MADWGDCFVKHLFDVCKEEIEAGNRPMGIFTTTGWKNVVSKFAEKSGDKRTKKQLKRRIVILRYGIIV
uniref:Myb/SANT-like domain-containing protein n=1 Tax=Oryza glumipatula TaxID=40148 RepID=A0A0E0AIN2_9ORYZ